MVMVVDQVREYRIRHFEGAEDFRNREPSFVFHDSSRASMFDRKSRDTRRLAEHLEVALEDNIAAA